MKINKAIIWFYLLTLLLAGCEKLPGEDCFKSTGETVIEHRSVGPFENIVLEDNINLILTQGNEEAISVRAGENLLESIITEVNNNELKI